MLSMDSSSPSSGRPNQPAPSPLPVSFNARLVLLSFFLPIAAALALPALGIGVLIWWQASKTWDYRERWSGTWLMAVIGIIVYALIIWLGYPLPPLLVGLHWLGLLWMVNLCSAPTCALILEGLHPMTRRVRLLPRYPVTRPVPAGGDASISSSSLSPASPVIRQRGASVYTPRIIPPPALVRAAKPLPMVRVPSLEPLGAYLSGELYEWVYGNQLCIPPEALRLHGVVLGEPGYGKTMTLLRLAIIAMRYGMQVIFLDLKGSRKTAALFVAAMRYAGARRIKVYPQETYDGWRGDATAIYNRLMALVDPGIHPYYARVDSALVSLAVHAPCGPPRSSQDLLLRFDPGWLRRAYAGRQHWYAQRKIRKVAPQIDATSLAFDGFFDAASRGLDGTFAFEDGDAIYVGLDGSALKEQAASIGRYLLEDGAHYTTYRKPARLHALMIIDEFGVLKTSNATNLYERVREAGMAMWAAAQSYQGLGPERASVLAASSIKILHRCGDPEEVVRFAGMRDQPAFSQTIDDGEDEILHPFDTSRKRTSVRMQRVYTMPIEDVQQLSQGAIALITGGLSARCQVHPLALPPELLQEATAFVAARQEMQQSEVPAPPSPPPISGRPRGRTGSSSLEQPPVAPPSQGMLKVGAPPTPATTPEQPPVPQTPLEPGDSAKANLQRPADGEDDSPVDF